MLEPAWTAVARQEQKLREVQADLRSLVILLLHAAHVGHISDVEFRA